jgi:hypothetical protein
MPFGFTIDPFMRAGLTAFFIPTALGCLAYALATVLARMISPKPRHVYIGRLLFLLVFVPAVMIYSTPNFVFSGTRERWLPIWVKLVGAEYGTYTVPIWLIIALFKRPKADKTTPPNKAAMRISTSYIFIGAVILAVADIGVFLFLRPKDQTHTVLNNGRPFDDATLAQMKKEDALVLSMVPLGTAFTNAVAALGSDYTTVRFSDTMYYAQFKCILPGMTNISYVHFRVESNIVVWTGYIKIRFPAHPSDVSKT